MAVVLAVLAALLWAGAWGISRWLRDNEPKVAGSEVEVVVAAVGDMACAPAVSSGADTGSNPARCQEVAVSDAILASRPDLLLALGDAQYERGDPQGWGPYDRSYGRMRDITRPVPGNHEYLTPGAGGYYSYFGGRAGPAGRGYYSFDTGAWHVVGLNSQCREVGGCDDGSPQLMWLRSDLSGHNSRCTLAYWHIPRFSSGQHGDHVAYRTLWRTLTEHGVDLVLAGHDHNYERLARLNADGRRDDSVGIRSFVVGTGGRNLRPVEAQNEGSERVIDEAFGFLELGLRSTSYAWRFKGVDGAVLDAGEDQCH